MREFKGTKGKWLLGDEKYYNGNKAFEIWYGNDGECIAEVVHDIEDAKLISCAPEMLEMLNKINDFIDKNRYKNYMVELLRREVSGIEQLIKKATS